jgi:hypothetical protein
MVPSQAEIDGYLSLIVQRLGEFTGLKKNHIKQFMNQPMLEFNNCTPMQYVYLGLGQMVLNYVDDWAEQLK